MVAAAELPSSLCSDLGCAFRSCIRDTRTGQSRLEVIWAERKFLVESLDCGSIGWPSKFWMASAAGLRSAFLADPCHLRYNRLKGAVKASGLWVIWLEGSILFSVRKGPRAGAAHFASIAEAANNYFATSSWRDPLFAQLYPLIIADLYQGQLPPESFTESHMQESGSGCRAAKSSTRKARGRRARGGSVGWRNATICVVTSAAFFSCCCESGWRQAGTLTSARQHWVGSRVQARRRTRAPHRMGTRSWPGTAWAAQRRRARTP